MKDILTFLSLIGLILWNMIKKIAKITERVREWKEKRRNPRDITRKGHQN